MLCAHFAQADTTASAPDWEKSRAEYSAKLKENPAQPAAFFYNYGTAAMQAAAPGEGFVALTKAFRMAPAESDIRTNLALARTKTSGIALQTQPATWISWWPADLRAIPTASLAIIGLLFLAPFLYASTRNRGDWWRWPAGSLAMIFLLTACLAAWDRREPEGGVLLLTKVLAGPAKSFPEIGSLEPGSLVNIEEERDGYYKIRYVNAQPPATVGWVEVGSVLGLGAP